MAYQPGQTAKGYVLGEDRQWYPVGDKDARPVPNGFGARYRRRWPFTALILGTLNAVSSTSQEYEAHPHAEWAGLLLFLVLSFVAGALFLGSLVCLIVALPGGSAPPPKRLARPAPRS